MVIGFKKRFIKPILAKTKKHTIRKDAHNRWKEGMKMHMATGVRTKKYNQFNEDTCKSIQQLFDEDKESYVMWMFENIDGKWSSEIERELEWRQAESEDLKREFSWGQD